MASEHYSPSIKRQIPLVLDKVTYSKAYGSIASSPGLRGEGKGRPGTHCMRMRHVFRIFYRKSVRKSTGRTCSYHGEGLPK